MSDLTLRIRPDKIGSACSPFGFGPYLTVQPEPVVREGAAIVCRVLTARESYGDLELRSGRSARLVPGDIIVGVLGNRAALRGFSGRVPSQLANGDKIDLLNLGGVMGVSQGTMVGLGEPIKLEVLGTPVLSGKPALLEDHALEPYFELPSSLPPVIIVAGTCMNSGKSTAAAVLIRQLRQQGKRVHAGKATGVAAIRDLLAFLDHGAVVALSFLDCGIPSTAYRTDIPQVMMTLLGHLAAEEPDVIVVELGDGLMGAYGVDEILGDSALASRFSGAVLAANDIVGAWAATQTLRSCGIDVAVVTGPATDNLAGIDRLRSLGVPAANIFREPAEFVSCVARCLEECP